jgi:uncharacterized protein YndB with AHSA1/START domain
MSTRNAVTSMRSAAESADRVLTIERVFDAPRHLVFKAWTEPQQLYRWFGPRGFTISSYTLDPRPGAPWRTCMVSPEGREYWVRGVFQEVVEPSRLSFTWAHEDANGALRHETLVTVTFADVAGGKTLLTLHQEIFESTTARDEHQSGWTSALECLVEYLATA